MWLLLRRQRSGAAAYLTVVGWKRDSTIIDWIGCTSSADAIIAFSMRTMTTHLGKQSPCKQPLDVNGDTHRVSHRSIVAMGVVSREG